MNTKNNSKVTVFRILRFKLFVCFALYMYFGREYEISLEMSYWLDRTVDCRASSLGRCAFARRRAVLTLKYESDGFIDL